MRKVKLLLTIAAIAITVMLCCSINAFALTDGDWEFQLLDNEVMITGYIGDDVDVVVPDTIYGYSVTSMEMNYARNLRNAISVQFPSKLRVLHNTVFHDYYGAGTDVLETVVLPEGLVEIRDCAFNGCPNLKNINVPSTVKNIGDHAFRNTAITHIELPAGVENVGERAFMDCKLLKTIQMPENIKSIGEHCFVGSGIVDIYLPFVENMGGGLFYGCTDLQRATIAVGCKSLKTPYAGNGMFEDCTSLEEVSIPNTIEEIEGSCFKGCESLSQIILPTSLKRIGWWAFKDTAIEEIVIPYGVLSIDEAFVENEDLKSVYIPDTVTEMDGWMLKGSPNCIIYCSSNSYAEQFCKENKISYLTDNSVNSGITVLYNGTRISFHSYGQNPELLNSRTLVPLRSIFEAMGADVDWDDATSTAIAKRGGIEAKIQIGANEMYKNGKAISVDVPAMLLNDRTMVPVRVIAEAFGADVDWNDSGRVVFITENR